MLYEIFETKWKTFLYPDYFQLDKHPKLYVLDYMLFEKQSKQYNKTKPTFSRSIQFLR